MAEAVSANGRTGRKRLTHIVLRKAENGGHTAEHNYEHYEHRPETHVFGSDEGGKLVAHLRKHLAINDQDERELEAEEEGTKRGLGDKVRSASAGRQPKSRYDD